MPREQLSAIVVVALAACAPSMSELRAPVDTQIARRFELRAPIHVDELLAKPLDESAAVRIALANSPRLAAVLDELGVAGSELASALAPGPLQVDVQLRFGGGAREYEVDAIQPVLSLITSGRRRAAAHADIAAARAEATATAVRLAARVELAFHDLLAAQQELALRREVLAAADAAATIRERMRAAGNTTELAEARDRDAREQAQVDVTRAEAALAEPRERLNALLGLPAERTKWTVADVRLADIPGDAPALDDLETTAATASLELTGDRARRDAAASRLGDARLHAWLPELGLGVSVLDKDSTIELGPALRIGLPLFDHGSGPRARASAQAARAEHELAAVSVELSARARAARAAALGAYAEARRLRDGVLPLRQKIVEETLLHYNAMDADPFQLILARRELADAHHQQLDALRRYANAMSEIAALRRGAML